MQLLRRPRRNRKSAAVRSLVRETRLHVSDLIYPLFLHAESHDSPIDSLPGCMRFSLQGLLEQAQQAWQAGIRAVILFPAISEQLKTADAAECYNPEGLIPQAIKLLKSNLPELVVISDIALDPYNSDGHDGIVRWQQDGSPHIDNDASVEVLCKQALCHAAAGIDIIAPSDMMDGRVEALRRCLDQAGYQQVSIMAYSAKYASALYGPFRGALDSAPKAGDKMSYQMDPGNRGEALLEAELDQQEGADFLLVKPASCYLDIIADLKANFSLPLVAYHVSGEYLMLKAAAASGWIDEKKAALEIIGSIKRAGADIIITYYALQIAQWLNQKD